MRVTDPLRKLDRAAWLAKRALDGDPRALCEFNMEWDLIAKAMPSVSGLADHFINQLKTIPDGCCSCVVDGYRQGELFDPTVASDEREILDESALAWLVCAVDTLYGQGNPEQISRGLDCVVALIAAAELISGLARALRTGGLESLTSRMEALSALGMLDPFRSTNVASLAILAEMPNPRHPTMQLMGFAPPSIPDFDLPIPDLPGLNPLDDLIAKLKGRKVVDPEIWDPPYYWWWRKPVEYFPPGWISHLACVLEVIKRKKARAAILPPARPARVTWTAGISHIVSSGACVGDTIVIHGTGFVAIRASAVLLLPFVDGCHPVDVPASRWQDTKITLKLPAGVVSGPIGFGDRNYVEAYNSWADEQNRLADEIRQFKCGRLVGSFIFVKPFAECPPDIGINHLHAGSAIIDAFTAGGQSQLPIEPLQSVLLAWHVRNAEHIRIDRISATGPLFGGAVTLVDPATNTWLLGPFSYNSPTNFRYRLTATGPCGTVTREVVVSGSRRPRLVIEIYRSHAKYSDHWYNGSPRGKQADNRPSDSQTWAGGLRYGASSKCQRQNSCAPIRWCAFDMV